MTTTEALRHSALCLSALLIVPACSEIPFVDNEQGSDFPGVTPPAQDERRLSVRIEESIEPTALQLFAGAHSASMNDEGIGIANVRSDGAQALVAGVESGSPLLMAISTGSESEVRLDAATTAVALVFLGPGIATTEPALARDRLSTIGRLAEIHRLAALIDARLLNGDTNFLTDVSDSELIGAVAAAHHAALTQLNNMLRPDFVLSSPGQSSGIEIVNETPTADGGTRITVENMLDRWVTLVESYASDGQAFTSTESDNGPWFFPTHLIPGHGSTSIDLNGDAPFAQLSVFGIGNDFLSVDHTDPLLDYSVAPIALSIALDLLLPTLEVLSGFDIAVPTEGLTSGSCLGSWLDEMTTGVGGIAFVGDLLAEMAEQDLVDVVVVVGSRAFASLVSRPEVVVCLAEASGRNIALSLVSQFVAPLRMVLLAFQIRELAEGLIPVFTARVRSDFLFLNRSLLSGGLTVTLDWDALNDVDLHLLEPSGEEIYFRNPTSALGGVLDRDSNRGCLIDGINRETISYPARNPPPGWYQVGVFLFADCGIPRANFTLTVNNGTSQSVRTGRVTTTDTSVVYEPFQHFNQSPSLLTQPSRKEVTLLGQFTEGDKLTTE
jgi:hypothetical protein